MGIFSMHLHNILSLTPSFHSLCDFVSQCLANFALGCNLVSQENAPVLHNLVSRATIVVQLQSDSTPRVMRCKWSVHRSHGHLNAMNSFTRSLYMRENTEYNHSQSEWRWLPIMKNACSQLKINMVNYYDTPSRNALCIIYMPLG